MPSPLAQTCELSIEWLTHALEVASTAGPLGTNVWAATPRELEWVTAGLNAPRTNVGAVCYTQLAIGVDRPSTECPYPMFALHNSASHIKTLTSVMAGAMDVVTASLSAFSPHKTPYPEFWKDAINHAAETNRLPLVPGLTATDTHVSAALLANVITFEIVDTICSAEGIRVTLRAMGLDPTTVEQLLLIGGDDPRLTPINSIASLARTLCRKLLGPYSMGEFGVTYAERDHFKQTDWTRFKEFSHAALVHK